MYLYYEDYIGTNIFYKLKWVCKIGTGRSTSWTVVKKYSLLYQYHILDSYSSKFYLSFLIRFIPFVYHADLHSDIHFLFEKYFKAMLLRLWVPQWLRGNESACNAGITEDAGSIPGSGRSPGEGHGNPLQYSCLENPVDRAWWATVHGVTKGRTWLKWLNTHALSL